MNVTGRRGLLLAVVGCAVAATVLLLASGPAWLQVSLPARPPLPAVSDALTGQDVVPTLMPVGILVAAAGLALVATRLLGRLIVAAVLVAAGLLVAGRIGFLLYDDGFLASLGWAQTTSPTTGDSLFPDRDFSKVPAVFALLACGIVIAVGISAIVGSRRWPVMGARFERRTRRADGTEKADQPAVVPPAPTGPSTAGHPDSVDADPTADEAAMWAAIDRGQDPTVPSAPPRLDPATEPTRDRPDPGP